MDKIGLNEFLAARKLNIRGQEPESKQNETKFWEYNELQHHARGMYEFESNERRFLDRERMAGMGKEMHFACVDICETQQPGHQMYSFEEGMCMRNCLGKFINFYQILPSTRKNTLGQFLINRQEKKQREALGFKSNEELMARAKELEDQIDWEALNKPNYL